MNSESEFRIRVLNQKHTSTNKPSLDSLVVQCGCSIPWSKLDLKGATATGKCKRWVLALSHAPKKCRNQAKLQWVTLLCVFETVPWVGEKESFASVPQPQQHGQGELALQEPSSSLIPEMHWNAVSFIHTFPMNITLFNKDCTLFVPFLKSFLPCWQVAVAVNLRRPLLGSLCSQTLLCCKTDNWKFLWPSS